jgi:hypothetical protein
MSGSITNSGSVTTSTDSSESSNSDSTSAGSTSSGTRDPSQTPFASDSVFNLPLGSNAQWQPNGQLSNADVFVNTTQSGYNENIYTGSANDPLVMVTSSGTNGGSQATYQVHIPSGAVPASGTDNTFTVDDTTSGTWYSFGGFHWTGSDTASASQASTEPDTGSGITQDGSNFDEGVGTLRESDLQAGTIDHMLRIEIPTSMAEAVGGSFSDLASYVWPQTQEDGFAVNGNGGTPYSGTIPYGATIGIPQGTPEPANVAANAGANMLWQALQDHGAMIRDTTGASGNNIVIQADQNVNSSDPLVQGMDQYGAQIMAATEILTNQGPNSVNGGGTPVVPLDPPVSDASGSSGATNQQSGSGSSSSNDTTVTSGTTNQPSGSGSSSGSSSNDTTITSGTTTQLSGSGSSSGTTDNTTAPITSQTLAGGQSDSSNSSGMTFMSSSNTSDPTSDTSGASVGAGAADDSPSGSSSGIGASDFTPPTPSGGWPSITSASGTGDGQGAWWATHYDAPATFAVQQN